MTAEAREYRETKAIEKATKDNPALCDAWIERQLELEPVAQYFDEEVEAVERGQLEGRLAVDGNDHWLAAA